MMIQTRNQGKLSIFWQMIKKSFAEIRRNDPMRMAGATAFFPHSLFRPSLLFYFTIQPFLSKIVAAEMMAII
jgi:hypothetical protein